MAPRRRRPRDAAPLSRLASIVATVLSLVAAAAAVPQPPPPTPPGAVPASAVARAALALAEPWQACFPRQWDRRERQLGAIRLAGGVPLLASPHGRLLAHRARLLSPSAAARGLSHLGPAHRLRRFLHRAARGSKGGARPLRVAAVGGSVSWGSAVERGSEDWPSVVTRRLRDYYPRAKFELTNGCVPAAPASFTSACLQKLVPGDADLVFVEFAVNESGAGEKGEPAEEGRAAAAARYERLLRKLLRLPRRPAVVLVQLPAVGMAMGEGHPWRRGYGQTVEDALSAIGAYYDAPAVSLRSAAWRLAREHAHGLNWTDFYDSPSGDRYDFIHPLAPGHRAVADLVLHALGEVALGLALRPWSGGGLPSLSLKGGGGDREGGRRQEPPGGRESGGGGSFGGGIDDDNDGGDDRAEALAPLPEPLHPRNYADANLACAHGAALAAHVVSAEGFELVDEGVAPKQKVGYVAWEPGARLVLRVDTSGASLGGSRSGAGFGGSGGGGEDGGGGGSGVGGGFGLDGGGEPAGVAVQLAYLRSYKHMGRASVECLGGCTCGAGAAAAPPAPPNERGDSDGGGGGGPPTGAPPPPPPPATLVLDGHHDVWQTTVYLAPFSPSPAADCRVAVTVLNTTGSPDRGTKFKITGLMATLPPRGSLAADEAAALLSAASEEGGHAALQHERWLGQVNDGEAPAAEEVLKERRRRQRGAAREAAAAAEAGAGGGGAAGALELPRSRELETQRRERHQASARGDEP